MALASRSNDALAASSVNAGQLGAATQPRVLLVDDDVAVRNALRRVLERRGYRVIPCGSCGEALGHLAMGSYDAMVSDVRMPGMSGVKLLRAVREHDLDLPVILVTGNPDLASATEAVEYGAFQYLIKPVESERLDQVLERAAAVGCVARVKRDYVEEYGSATFGVGDRAGISATLERALGSVWVAYQPIFNAQDQSLYAHEALMRSNEPKLRLGRKPGYDLVREPASRRSERRKFVCFERAAHALREARSAGDHRARFARAHSRPARARSALAFRIALDDLGAGYAGLTSFTQLEPEFVKLDMELIRDIHEQTMKRKIVRSMVELCHDTGS